MDIYAGTQIDTLLSVMNLILEQNNRYYIENQVSVLYSWSNVWQITLRRWFMCRIELYRDRCPYLLSKPGTWTICTTVGLVRGSRMVYWEQHFYEFWIIKNEIKLASDYLQSVHFLSLTVSVWLLCQKVNHVQKSCPLWESPLHAASSKETAVSFYNKIMWVFFPEYLTKNESCLGYPTNSAWGKHLPCTVLDPMFKVWQNSQKEPSLEASSTLILPVIIFTVFSVTQNLTVFLSQAP